MEQHDLDKSNPEHVILMLEEILRILSQKKEKLCVECKKIYPSDKLFKP